MHKKLISVGMCDGIREHKGLRSLDNAKAAVFTQAIKEMER